LNLACAECFLDKTSSDPENKQGTAKYTFKLANGTNLLFPGRSELARAPKRRFQEENTLGNESAQQPAAKKKPTDGGGRPRTYSVMGGGGGEIRFPADLSDYVL
jgi:hypothetical protein